MENEIRKPLGNSVLSLWWQYRMKYQYHYTPWDQWESMDEVLPPHFKGRFVGNKNCELKNLVTGKIWRLEDWCISEEGYQIATIGDNKVEKCFKFIPSVRFSKKFLFNPEPEIRIIVDHIDRHRKHLELKNHRFVTRSENSINSKKHERKSDAFLVYSQHDINLIFPIGLVKYSDLSSYMKRGINQGIKKSNGYYKGLRYKYINIDLEEYKKKYGPPIDREWDPEHPELGGWKDTKYKGVRANSNGYFLINGKLTIGSEDTDGYRSLYIKGRAIACHRLMVETFQGYLTQGLVISHEKGERSHNSIDYLKECTQSENLENEYTYRGDKEVVKIDPDTGYCLQLFKSIKDGANNVNITPEVVSAVCSYRNNLAGGYLWAWKGDEENRWKQFSEHIKTCNKLPKNWWTEKRILKAIEGYSKWSDFRKNYKHARSVIGAAKKQGIDLSKYLVKCKNQFT